MIITKEVAVKWNKRNREWYENKGYIFTAYSEVFFVKPMDLTIGSHIKVTVACDYCKKENERLIKDYFKQRAKTTAPEDVCNDCGWRKSRNGNKVKYGVENPMHLESAKENLKNTMLEKYGTENPSYVPEVIEKRKQTMLENFGVESYFMTEQFKEDVKRTSLEKYGVEHHGMAPEIIEKRLKTLYQQGNGACSAQQKYIHNLIGGALNYPINTILLDIAFPDEKIYVEYDGGGHDLSVKLGHITKEEFNKKEQRRAFSLLDRGWREIRIICESDKLLHDEAIINFIESSKKKIQNKESRFIVWNMDTNLVSVSNKVPITLEDFLQK